jgi:hypothetical protein
MLVPPISTLRGFVFLGAFVALLCPSCANKPPSGGPGTYRGVFAGTAEAGTVEVTVGEARSGPLPASGTIDLGGKVVSLSGTLDQSSASLSLSSTDGYQLAGISRPAYVFGSYQDTRDYGTFALILEPATSSPIQLFCGSLVDTSTTGTTPSQTFPFAVTAVPSGAAICVGLNNVWFGGLYASDGLSCGTGSTQISGYVDADGGNQWGTGTDDQGNGDYGTWTVAPCGGGAADGGVDSGADNGPDAGASGVADG